MDIDTNTLDLFGQKKLPQGLKYQPEFIGPEEEKSLLRSIEVLPFKEFEFRGFSGKRRTVSFGWRYDFNGGGLSKTEEMPEFLARVGVRAELFAESAPGSFQHVLVTEYSPGAGIGWHKDRFVFGDVVGISLLSAARLDCAKERKVASRDRPLSQSHVPSISFVAHRARTGSKASRGSKAFAIHSPFALYRNTGRRHELVVFTQSTGNNWTLLSASPLNPVYSQ